MLSIISIFLLGLLILGIFLRQRQGRNDRQEQIRQFVLWKKGYNSSVPAFQLWKRGLSIQEGTILFDLVQGYCTSLDWELDWLLSPQIQKAPELQAAKETSINNYLETIFFALQKDLDVKAYLALVEFEKKPTARKHQAVIEPLYEKISRDGLIPQAKRVFSRVTRRKANASQQIAAIQHAFEHDPKRAMLRLKEVVGGDDSLISPQLETNTEDNLQPQSPPPILTGEVAAEATA